MVTAAILFSYIAISLAIFIFHKQGAGEMDPVHDKRMNQITVEYLAIIFLK